MPHRSALAQSSISTGSLPSPRSRSRQEGAAPTEDGVGSASPSGRRTRLRAPGRGWGWLALPGLIFLLLFFAWPLIGMVARSFVEPEPGLGNYARFLASTPAKRSLLTTLQSSVFVTGVTLAIGYPFAYLMNSVGPRVAAVLQVAVFLPLWLSLLVRTYAWQVILRDTGLLNTFLQNVGVIDAPVSIIRTPIAATIGMVSVLIPFMVLPTYVVMRRIDPEYSLAAASLGASPAASFVRVFLPLSLPGILAGSLIVFVLSLGFYITPALLGSIRDLFISEVVVQEIQHLNWGYGSAIGVVLLGVTLGVLLVASRFVRVGDVFGGSFER